MNIGKKRNYFVLLGAAALLLACIRVLLLPVLAGETESLYPVNVRGYAFDHSSFPYFGNPYDSMTYYEMDYPEGTLPVFCIQAEKGLMDSTPMRATKYDREHADGMPLIGTEKRFRYIVLAYEWMLKKDHYDQARYALVQSYIWGCMAGHEENWELQGEAAARLDEILPQDIGVLWQELRQYLQTEWRKAEETPSSGLPVWNGTRQSMVLSQGSYELRLDASDCPQLLEASWEFPEEGWHYQIEEETRQIVFRYDGSTPPRGTVTSSAFQSEASRFSLYLLEPLDPSLQVQCGWMERGGSRIRVSFSVNEEAAQAVRRFRHSEPFEAVYQLAAEKRCAETGQGLSGAVWEIWEDFDGSQVSGKEYTEGQASDEQGLIYRDRMNPLPLQDARCAVMVTDEEGRALHRGRKGYYYSKTYCTGHPAPVWWECTHEAGSGCGCSLENDRLRAQWLAEQRLCAAETDFHVENLDEDDHGRSMEARERMLEDRDATYEAFLHLRYRYALRETGAAQGYILHGIHPEDLPVESVCLRSVQAGGSGERDDYRPSAWEGAEPAQGEKWREAFGSEKQPELPGVGWLRLPSTVQRPLEELREVFRVLQEEDAERSSPSDLAGRRQEESGRTEQYEYTRMQRGTSDLEGALTQEGEGIAVTLPGFEEDALAPVTPVPPASADAAVYTLELKDHRTEGRIVLNKRDRELYERDGEDSLGKSQGDAVLEGAVYGLFAAEDIRHPDGKTGIVYRQDDLTAEAETDELGNASFTHYTREPGARLSENGTVAVPPESSGRRWTGQPLLMGGYYIRELRRSEGYELDQGERRSLTGPRTAASGWAAVKTGLNALDGRGNDGAWRDIVVAGQGVEAYELAVSGYPRETSFYQVTMEERTQRVSSYGDSGPKEETGIRAQKRRAGLAATRSQAAARGQAAGEGWEMAAQRELLPYRFRTEPDRAGTVSPRDLSYWDEDIKPAYLKEQASGMLSGLGYERLKESSGAPWEDILLEGKTNGEAAEELLDWFAEHPVFTCAGIGSVTKETEGWRARIYYDCRDGDGSAIYDASDGALWVRKSVPLENGASKLLHYWIRYEEGEYRLNGSVAVLEERREIQGTISPDEAIDSRIETILSPAEEPGEPLLPAAGDEAMAEKGRPSAASEIPVRLLGEKLTRLEARYDEALGIHRITVRADETEVVCRIEGTPERNAAATAWTGQEELQEKSRVQRLLYPGQYTVIQDGGTEEKPLIVLEQVIRQPICLTKRIADPKEGSYPFVHRDAFTERLNTEEGMASLLEQFTFKIYLKSALKDCMDEEGALLPERLEQAGAIAWDGDEKGGPDGDVTTLQCTRAGGEDGRMGISAALPYGTYVIVEQPAKQLAGRHYEQAEAFELTLPFVPSRTGGVYGTDPGDSYYAYDSTLSDEEMVKRYHLLVSEERTWNTPCRPGEFAPVLVPRSPEQGLTADVQVENRYYQEYLEIEKRDGETGECILHEGALFRIYAAKRDIREGEGGQLQGSGCVLFGHAVDAQGKLVTDERGEPLLYPSVGEAQEGEAELPVQLDAAGVPCYDESQRIRMRTAAGQEAELFQAYSTADGTGVLKLPEPLGAGVYVLVEVQAPKGYAAGLPVAFEIYADGAAYYEAGRRVRMEEGRLPVNNQPLKAELSKKEASEEEPFAEGAAMALYYGVELEKTGRDSYRGVTVVREEGRVVQIQNTNTGTHWELVRTVSKEGEGRLWDLAEVPNPPVNLFFYDLSQMPRADRQPYALEERGTVLRALWEDPVSGICYVLDENGARLCRVDRRTGMAYVLDRAGRQIAYQTDEAGGKRLVQSIPGSAKEGGAMTIYNKEAKESQWTPSFHSERWNTEKGAHCAARIPAGAYIWEEEQTPPGGFYVRGEALGVLVEAGSPCSSETETKREYTMRNDYTKAVFSKLDARTGAQVVGAEMTLYRALTDEQGRPLADSMGRYQKGEPYCAWLSGEEWSIHRIPVGAYVWEETACPWELGYLQAAPMNVTILETGEVQRFTMVDGSTFLEIQKRDGRTGELLPRERQAELTLYPAVLDEQGNPVSDGGIPQYREEEEIFSFPAASWQDREEADGRPGAPEYHELPGTAQGRWFYTRTGSTRMEYLPRGYYVLAETGVPAGYGKAKPVLVDLMRNEKTPGVWYGQMLNEPLQLEISKRAAPEGGEIKGARLAIYPVEGDRVSESPLVLQQPDGEGGMRAVTAEWISGMDGEQQPHAISYIPAGRYVLKELAAPYGFLQAAELSFSVEDDHPAQQVTLLDEIPMGTLRLVKEDAAQPEKRLEGARFTLINQTLGIECQTMLTDEQGLAVFDPQPIGAVGADGSFLAYTYQCLERKAPEGYLLLQKPWEFQFPYQDGNTREITLTYRASNDSRQVKVDKILENTGEYLEGAVLRLERRAKLRLLGPDDWETVREWTTGKQTYYASGLEPGYYRIVETKAPMGVYALAEPVYFMLHEAEAEPPYIILRNQAVTAEIQKQSEEGTLLGGARLQLLRESTGELVGEWTSECEKGQSFSLLEPGAYRIRELEAPEGYERAEDQVIVLAKQEAGCQVFSFLNRRRADSEEGAEGGPEERPAERTAELLLMKRDGSSGEGLAGACLEAERIPDEEEAGAKPYRAEGITGEHGILRLALPCPGRYWIREKEAPAGYRRSDRQYEAALDANGGITGELVLYNFKSEGKIGRIRASYSVNARFGGYRNASGTESRQKGGAQTGDGARLFSAAAAGILCLAGAMVCGGYVVRTAEGYRIARSHYEELRRLPAEREEITEQGGSEKKRWEGVRLLEERERALRERNPDYCLWLTVPGTPVDYPVVQGQDNQFYLSHDFDRRESIAGAVFLDARGEALKGRNTVIYGHNMKDGSMLAALRKYERPEFYEKNRIIRVCYQGRWLTCPIFSCQLRKEEDLAPYQEPQTEAEWKLFLADMRSASLFHCGGMPAQADRILTLSTCFGTKKRMIVQALVELQEQT